MATTRQRRLRAPGSALLVALLLVPVLATGHRHVGHATSPCAACVVTQHTPVVSPGLLSVPTAILVVVGVEPVESAPPPEPAVRHATSRGPPAPLSQGT
jgi:hypothetical protein